MDFMQFILRRPTIEASGAVAIGARKVPYPDLRLETVFHAGAAA